MEPTTVTSKGQVTIPKEIRQRLGIRKGTKVAFHLEGGQVEIRLIAQPVPPSASGFGMLKSPRVSVPADFDPASLLKAEDGTP